MASAYTEAWKPWDDRFADHVIARRNWQLAFGAMALVTLALAVAVVWLSSRVRYVAYVVEVDKLGYALALAQPLAPTAAPATSPPAPKQLSAFQQWEREEFLEAHKAAPMLKSFHDQSTLELARAQTGGANADSPHSMLHPPSAHW